MADLSLGLVLQKTETSTRDVIKIESSVPELRAILNIQTQRVLRGGSGLGLGLARYSNNTLLFTNCCMQLNNLAHFKFEDKLLINYTTIISLIYLYYVIYYYINNYTTLTRDFQQRKKMKTNTMW